MAENSLPPNPFFMGISSGSLGAQELREEKAKNINDFIAEQKKIVEYINSERCDVADAERKELIAKIEHSILDALDIDLEEVGLSELKFDLMGLAHRVDPQIKLYALNPELLISKQEFDKLQSSIAQSYHMVADKEIEHTLVKVFGFSASEAKVKTPAARDAILALKNHDTAAETSVAENDLPQSLPPAAPTKWVDRKIGETVEDFLRRVWKPWIDARLLTRPDLYKIDMALYRALGNRPLPDDLYVPTKSEAKAAAEAAARSDPKVLEELREARSKVTRLERVLGIR